MRHFFPDLIPLLKQIKDPRHQSYINYEGHVILFVRVLAVVFHIGSMRKITGEFNNENSIENVKRILNLEDLQELPHWKTINDYLEKINETKLESIIQKLVYRLIRMKSFNNSRIRNKYWQIIIDGTGLYDFGNLEKPHCQHCLKREYKDKQGNVIRTQYYHYVLEAKLVINGNIVISIATEFAENETSDVSKQDCELNAFYRMAVKLKKSFPHLPVCLSMDSLYACNPVFDICLKNNWRYIIRFKDGSIPSVAEEFHVLKEIETNHIFTKIESDTIKTYKYVTNIPYKSHILNLVEYTRSNLPYPFVFLTDLPVSNRNYESLVEDGRRRWKIENEGFNTQKNHGYDVQHLFSKNYTAMKNHYLLIQIGHMIAQFFTNAYDIWKIIKMPLNEIFQHLLFSFKNSLLTHEDIKLIDQRRQYRFP